MAPSRASSTPIPSTETPANATSTSTLTDEQWDTAQTLLNSVYRYRTGDGYDPTKIFQRKVNKRTVPDYYDVIKEPMALSTIKGKIAAKEYKDFKELVRDFALIVHNAQVYNRPDSGAYQDALVIKKFLEDDLAKLVKDGKMSEEEAKWPYLGEIPTYAEEIPVAEDAEEEEEADEDEDDEDDEELADDSDEEGGKRRKKRGPRSTAAITKREGGSRAAKKEDKEDDPELRKKRGRPPRVDTPMEARIKAIMKGLRKPKNSQNQLKILHFERLPDKAAMPEYFSEIKNPIDMFIIKRKLKRKKYNTVEQFMKDVELMFNNAKQYNEDGSIIYKDAVDLLEESKKLYEEETKKPDSEYVMEEGRIPMPNGILHNGELWKVGDWVHIQNANDLTKPIVAQIYRTWKDVDGGEWVNACWYYRPEQTVHRFDKHFFENEVVKTGQYRDHPIDEVIDRCFVMFITRYNKGRPRDFPPNKEIYVCEARYNEEKHKLNKIKTWASCLPDEVRDKDYEMDLFDGVKKLKKVPSPIAYLLKDDQKESDEMPKPVWGAENAPPKIGAVHRRPRDPKDSPPPEPTPSPPPQPPPPPPRQISNISTHAANGYSGTPQPIATSTPTHPSQSAYTPTHSHHIPHHAPSASPAPLQPAPTPTFPPVIPQHSSFAAPQPSPVAMPAVHPTAYNRPAPTSTAQVAYKAPQAVEVWALPEQANNSIPLAVRKQFHTDDNGRVLFFTVPPVETHEERPQFNHTARYLAAKAKREQIKAVKRKREAEEAGAREEEAKRARSEEVEKVREGIQKLMQKATEGWEDGIVEVLVEDYKRLYGREWREMLDRELKRVGEL